MNDKSILRDADLFTIHRCFICNNHRPESLTPEIDKAYRNNEENGNMLRIVCQLLRVKWDTLLDHISLDEVPFCSDCTGGVMGLIDLREQLLRLETEMMHCIHEMETKVASTISQKDGCRYGDIARNCFREQVMDEYNAKELLRHKIAELTFQDLTFKNEPIEVDQSHIIEVEPSFVQLHLGIRNRRNERKGFSCSTIKAVHASSVTDNLHDVSHEWINSQDRPLTRLRLSSSIPATSHAQSQDSVRHTNDELTNCDPLMHKIENEEDESLEPNGDLDQDNYSSDDNSNFEVDEDEEDDSDFEVSGPRKSRRKVSDCDITKRGRPTTKNGKKLKSGTVPKASPLRKWPAEEFSEIQVTEDGRRIYEGIEIHWRQGDDVRGEFILKCGLCPKEVDQKNSITQQRSAHRIMQMHIKAYHLDAYKCPQCGKSLRDHRRLILHTEMQHPPGGKQAKPRRARVFGSTKIPQELFVNEDGTLQFQDIQIVRLELDDEDFNIHCGACEKVFTKSVAHRAKQCPYRQMVNHIKAMHLLSFSCQICRKAFRCQRSLEKHCDKMHSDNPPELRCEICGRTISGEAYMRKHKWTHKNEQEKEEALAAGERGPPTYRELMEKRKAKGVGPSYQCSECGKTFHFGANLRRHEFVHRKDIKEHKCIHCGKHYNTAENLKSHIKYIHEVERVHKKYRCNYCPKWFVTKSPWQKHERTHTKQIPYYCPVCNKGFALKQSMMNHVRNKKCNTGPMQQHPPNSKRKPDQRKKQPRKIEHPKEDSSDAEGSEEVHQSNNLVINQLNLSGTGCTTNTMAINLQTMSHVPVQLEVPVLPLEVTAHRSTIASTIPVPFPFATYTRPFDQNYSQPQQYNNYI